MSLHLDKGKLCCIQCDRLFATFLAIKIFFCSSFGFSGFMVVTGEDTGESGTGQSI